jgi:hypothetical protein
MAILHPSWHEDTMLHSCCPSRSTVLTSNGLAMVIYRTVWITLTLVYIISSLCNRSDVYYDVLFKFYSENNHGSRHPGDNKLTECPEENVQFPKSRSDLHNN